jgi:hypothetical protein
VRHRDGEIFVGGEDRLRNSNAGLCRLRVGFDERREICAGVAEQVVDASIG